MTAVYYKCSIPSIQTDRTDFKTAKRALYLLGGIDIAGRTRPDKKG